MKFELLSSLMTWLELYEATFKQVYPESNHRFFIRLNADGSGRVIEEDPRIDDLLE